MSEQTGHGDSALLARAEAHLFRAEHRIRLLDRAVPRNLARERERLARELALGRVAVPAFEYTPAEDLVEPMRELGAMAKELSGGGVLAALYAERALELLLEAELATSLGRAGFAALAARRYPAAESAELEALLDEFSLAPEPEAAELIVASDATDPRSLRCRLEERIRALGLPVRVELRSELASVAAAGDGFVAVRASARLSAQAAERIAQHELVAHVLPRLSARRERLGIFRVGARQANEDEEGRALHIERRLDLMDSARKRELAGRHRVAVAVRAGANLNELMRALDDGGFSAKASLELGLRALRGGGLAREIVYLPAYLRVRAAFASEPGCERYFERGRVSLAALPSLRALELSH